MIYLCQIILVLIGAYWGIKLTILLNRFFIKWERINEIEEEVEQMEGGNNDIVI